MTFDPNFIPPKDTDEVVKGLPDHGFAIAFEVVEQPESSQKEETKS